MLLLLFAGGNAGKGVCSLGRVAIVGVFVAVVISLFILKVDTFMMRGYKGHEIQPAIVRNKQLDCSCVVSMVVNPFGAGT